MNGRNRARIPISVKNGRHKPIAMNRQRRVGETIAIQSWLRPALTPVIANKDFAIFREQLERVGGLLEAGLLEEMAMDFAVSGQEGASAVFLRQRTEFALKALRASDIYDAVCPRNPAELQRRLQEPQFVGLQRRRGSTEGRVAILKQRSGRRLRCRGFAHRHLAVAWVVLGHNLWVLAWMLIKQEKLKQAA
jgi:hypothetical protein